jgi:hypothetical protein
MEWARTRRSEQKSRGQRPHRTGRWSTVGAACVLGLAALTSADPTATGFPQEEGEPALAIDSPQWINLVGAIPSLELLNGQVVMLHFFEKGGRAANFNYPRKYNHDYGDKGLVVLGVTTLTLEELDEELEMENVPFPIAVESDMAKRWRVTRPNYQITIDTDGNVYHAGSGNSLWNGKLLKALKGADRYGQRQALRCVPSGEFSKSAKKALALMSAGELKKALKVIDTSIAREAEGTEKRIDAESLRKILDEHVALLLKQMELNAERGEVLIVRDALAVLNKDLSGHPLGEAVQSLDARLAEDKQYQNELQAAEEFQKLIKAYYQRGLEKNQARFKKLTETYPGTHAAQMARNVMQHRSL